MRKAPVPEIPETLLTAFESITETPVASALRSAAWKAFSEIGLPHTHDEDYSFTSTSELKNLLTRIPEANAKGGFETGKANGLDLYSLLSAATPESIVSTWKDIAAGERDVSSSLAMALAAEPTALRLKAGTNLEQPYPIVCNSNGARTDAALFFDMEPGSKAKIKLCPLSPSGGSGEFFNGSMVFHLNEEAELDLAQIDPAGGAQTLKLHFILERGAKLRFLSASTGGKFQRLAVEVDINGSDCEVDLRGAAVIGGVNRSHRHVLIRHHAPDCVSRQLFKAVVLGSGRSSVDGTVIVERGAQHTDAKQLLRHLMLSKDGKADAKPRLFIHADDVKCGHGATVGKMDADQLFYLRSRGLDAESANNLLTHAFLAEALDASALTNFREAARTRLLNALEEKA